MRAKAAAALETVGAGHLGARFLDELSSGEARRVMLARVLVTDPLALVLDEPTAGLDLAARHAFMERVRAVARAGTTVILVTHHLEEIIPEIGRVVLLSNGHVTADGPKAELLTPEKLSQLFGLPVAVERADGYHYARPRS
jgi:iron complex transport system ATP-binding protein